MTKNSYKRQKLAKQPINMPAVPPTVYETPKESLINFPSSIMNGITKESGLVSLTFKSITCAKLIENLDWMHDALIKKDGEFEPTRINENVFNADKMIHELKQDIQAIREKPQQSNTRNNINDLQNKLSDSLKNEETFRSFGDELVKQYESENPTKSINISNKNYSTTTQTLIPGISVDKFEDVKNPDLSAYKRKQIVQQPTAPEPETPIHAQTELRTSSVPTYLKQNNNNKPGVMEQVNVNQPSTNYQYTQSSSIQANPVHTIYPDQQYDNPASQGNYY